MRRIALMLTVLTAFAVTGCNNSSSGQNKAAAPKSSTVTGTVGLLKPRQLSPEATMQIQLQDASRDNAQPLASQTISPVKQMPTPFSFNIDSAKINPADIYVIDVKLVDGERTFNMPVKAPVITRGAPTTGVKIMLAANMTPEEKMMNDFQQLQKNLGAYSITNGRMLEKKVSHGWQTFRSNDTGKIVFVRENTDFGDKGFSNTDFAYKNGKPWMVVVKHKSSQQAKASEIDRAGWDQDGKLVLAEKEADGKTSKLSDADAADLHKQAMTMLALAKKKSPAKKKN
jgi:putative lipoprotein